MRRMGIGLGVGINRSNYAQGIFGAYQSRVVADGGVTEAGACVDAVSSLLQSASLLLIPSGYKSGKAYAEIPTNGNGDLTWTRGSDGFRTNASGLIQRVPWNLLQQSETFGDAYWFKQNSTVSTNTTTSPNGTLTADKLIPDTTSAQHRIYAVGPSLATGDYTFSCYAKADGYNFLSFGNAGGVNGSSIIFNLSNGTFSGTAGVITPTITNVGDNWYRCTISLNAAPNTSWWIVARSSNNTSDYTGNGTSGIFIWGAQLVEGTTAQTYLPTTDRLNFPRLSYMYGSCPSVLLEPQRTNSVFPSEDFSTTWSPNNTTVTTNATTAPDSNLTADRISITSNSGFIRRLSLTVLNSTSYTVSIFVKNDTISAGNTFRFYFNNNLSSLNAAEARAIIDINAGSVTSQSVGSGISGVSASMTSLTNGWYRVQLTFTLGATSGNTGAEIGFDAPTATRTFFAWGAQLEAGAYPTTYIPTTSATATRVADSFSRNNIYTNGLITSIGGTWFVELRNNISYVRDASSRIGFGDTSNLQNNSFFLSPQFGGGRFLIFKSISNSLTQLFATTTDTIKVAIKWNGTSADVFVNGTKQVSATAFTTTTMEFLFGEGVGVPTFVQQLALFNSPLTDTQCQTLTTL